MEDEEEWQEQLKDLEPRPGVEPPKSVHQYRIRGVTVEFPYDAYDCQLLYMEKVIQSLQEVRSISLIVIFCVCDGVRCVSAGNGASR